MENMKLRCEKGFTIGEVLFVIIKILFSMFGALIIMAMLRDLFR